MPLEPQLSSDQLLSVVYDQLRKLAAARLATEREGQTLQPTALVHEVWLRLSATGRTWEDRAHFYNAAAQAMRRILIDRARHKGRQKREGNWVRMELTELDLQSIPAGDRLLQIEEGLQRLEHQHPKAAEVVMLKFFAGLTNKEAAQTLGISDATVERRWTFAKVWLFQTFRELEG